MIPKVTHYVDMTGGSVGNTLTTTILSNSLHGTVSGTTMNPGTPTGLTVAARQRLVPDGVGIAKIGGYSHGIAERAIAIDHANNFMTAQIDFGSTAIRASMGFFVFLGPADAGGSSGLFDYVVMQDGFTGDGLTLQLQNGSPYALNLESNTGGTTHSPNFITKPNTWLWVTMHWDMHAGQGKAWIYHPDTFQILGKLQIVYTKAAIGAGGLGGIRMGNNEGQTSAGTTSYLQHILIDTQLAQFPLLPTKRPDIALPAVWRNAAGGGGGTTSQPASLTLMGVQ